MVRFQTCDEHSECVVVYGDDRHGKQLTCPICDAQKEAREEAEKMQETIDDLMERIAELEGEKP